MTGGKTLAHDVLVKKKMIGMKPRCAARLTFFFCAKHTLG